MTEMCLAIQQQQQALQRAVCDAVDPDGLLMAPAALGLAIYREAYTARLAAALRDNYLVLHRAMGDDEFDALAQAYIRARPSNHASIRWFGDRLADFLADEYSEQVPHPAMVDFARMDWALRGAFDGPSAPLLTLEHVKAVPAQDWADLRFHLHPTVRLQSLDWAIEPAWRALRAHDPESGEPAPELDEPQPSAHHLLIWREGLETRWRALNPLEAALLQGVGEKQSFAKLCETAGLSLDGDEQAAAGHVVGLLQRWLADGLLTDSSADAPSFGTPSRLCATDA